MARVVVLPDSPNLRQEVPANAVYIEEVGPDHLDDEPSAVQVLQRLEWAIREASAAATRRPALTASSVDGVRREMRSRA